MVLKNSKPYIGFDDRPLILAGVFINSIVAISIFYQSAIFKVPFLSFLYKGLEYLIVVSLLWVVLREVFLFNKIRFPGPENRKKRWLYLPVLLLPFSIIIYLYINYIQPELNFVMPGYENPSLFRIWVTGLTILLIDVAVYTILIYIYELNKAKFVELELKKENALNQLKALKDQLSPHFLNNSLNALLHLIDEDQQKSKEFVHQLAYLYNKIHEFSDQNLIALSQELDYLKAYIGLLEKRYGPNINFKINIPEHQMSKQIIPLSLQLGVENAVKHNIVTHKEALQITIDSSEEHVTIKNNYQPKKDKTESWGIGIYNMKKRYEILTKTNLTIENKDGLFTLKIPILDQNMVVNMIM